MSFRKGCGMHYISLSSSHFLFGLEMMSLHLKKSADIGLLAVSTATSKDLNTERAQRCLGSSAQICQISHSLNFSELYIAL